MPERQTVSFKISFEGERLSAKTLGGTITEFEKLLVAVAKDVGVKVHVFIESLEYKAHEATVGFLITTVRNAGGAGSDGSLVGETK